jgi:vacuolar-type H+-ATPase subunit F/Vma7
LSRIIALLREDLGSGFALAGIDVIAVEDAAGLRAALDEAVAGGSCGMVILEEELMRELPAEVRAGYAAVTVPLIIEVPGTIQWREEQALPFDDYVARLVRRAVGYQLNIKL